MTHQGYCIVLTQESELRKNDLKLKLMTKRAQEFDAAGLFDSLVAREWIKTQARECLTQRDQESWRKEWVGLQVGSKVSMQRVSWVARVLDAAGLLDSLDAREWVERTWVKTQEDSIDARKWVKSAWRSGLKILDTSRTQRVSWENLSLKLKSLDAAGSRVLMHRGRKEWVGLQKCLTQPSYWILLMQESELRELEFSRVVYTARLLDSLDAREWVER